EGDGGAARPRPAISRHPAASPPMLSESLRQRLSKLARSRAAGATPPTSSSAPEPGGAAAGAAAPSSPAGAVPPGGAGCPRATLLVQRPAGGGGAQVAAGEGPVGAGHAGDPTNSEACYLLIRPALGQLLDDAALRVSAPAGAPEIVGRPGRRLAPLD